ncbi:MAG: Mu transposase C-terminal domain-containing protein [Desulfobacterales bacterium]|nr:Mu transposase C-terminal domain-containing protein [Desulfobacterales bacterium]
MELATSELAKITGVAKSTISRRAKKERWSHKYITSRGGRKKVYYIDHLPEDIRFLIYKEGEGNTPPQPSPPAAERATSGGKVKAAERAASGGEVSAAERAAVDGKVKGEDAAAGGPGERACGENINSQQMVLAAAKSDLLALYLKRVKSARHGKKQKAREDFTTAYNSGIPWPELFRKIGPVSWKTLEAWKKQIDAAHGDIMVLADHRGHVKRGNTELSPEAKQVLIRCALSPNRPHISEAIRTARAVMAAKGVQNGLSDATYRRFLRDWRDTNYHIWVFNRQGAKAWNDKCAFDIARDYSLINVGDILVADGHTLNFEIVNPWTGKPKRMTLLVWFDMKSSMPLGWDITPTEDTACIASALRRAIMRLGKIPKVAYLDNGKAFAGRFFNGRDLEQAGFSGLFSRLGIKTIFAWPYHGQSKTVERFFKTFAELERLAPTYCGTSIETKPPRMNRGERLHRKAYDKAMSGITGITLEQAHNAIAAWFDEYASRPQRGHLNGASPMDVFPPEQGPGVDPAELRYLMLAQDIRTITQNGIKFLNETYYHPALYGRRHPVEIRYDLQDRSSILVVEPKTGELVCEAAPPEKAHPAASVLGTDEDRARLQNLIHYKKSQEKEASALAREFLANEILPEHRRHLKSMGISGDAAAEKPAAKNTNEPTDARINKDLIELKRMNQEVEKDPAPDASENYTPEVDRGEDAASLWDRIQQMPEPDRYEALIRQDVRGVLIPAHMQAFMSYFEATPAYQRDADYYEQVRAQAVVEFQAGTAAR